MHVSQSIIEQLTGHPHFHRVVVYTPSTGVRAYSDYTPDYEAAKQAAMNMKRLNPEIEVRIQTTMQEVIE